MLNMTKDLNGASLTIALEGRLDTTTAPVLESELKGSLDGIKELVFNLEKLQYISSAGLRVLLSAQKTMNKQGSMLIRNASEDIREIFTKEHISMIHHVHFSEPDLGPIQERDIYAESAELLKKCGYRRFVSLKMLEFPDVTLIQGVLRYFRHLTV